ncbi:MAG: DUF4142 domain-containing protein [Bacteroidota bacterium]
MKNFTLILLMSLAILNANGQTERDKKFVACMALTGLLEIKISELAEANGLAIEVKDIAKHMIDDHSKANNDLKLLADRKNISFPTTLNEKQQKMYDKMAKLKGHDFDKHYIKCIAKGHKKMKCEMKKEVKKGADVDIEAWAQANLPTVQHHQDMTKAACKSIQKK